MDYDIAIIGAGPTGLSFALSLKASGLNVVVIDKQPKATLAAPEYDGREIALTHLSKQTMQSHGSWQALDPDAISEIQNAKVMDGTSPYTLNFDQPPTANRPLGYLVSNHLIRKAIFETFDTQQAATLMDNAMVETVKTDQERATIKLSDGKTIRAQLMVASDTRFSKTRAQMGIATDERDYGRTAILCKIAHDQPHEQTAYECFLYGGTIATLPLNHQVSGIVITVDNMLLDHWLTMSDAALTTEINKRLNQRLGNISLVGKRYHYPLKGVHAKQFYANRFALIGDAAVGMHPVTAQGFNLGLSGQTILANEIAWTHAAQQPYWSEAVLKRYHKQHIRKTRVIYHGTNGIVKLFTNERRRAKLMRQAVLRISNHLPPVKWAVQQQLTRT